MGQRVGGREAKREAFSGIRERQKTRWAVAQSWHYSLNSSFLRSQAGVLRRQWHKNGSEAVEERRKGMRERRLRGSEAAKATQCVMRHPRTNSNLAGDDTNSSAEGIRAASSEKQRERERGGVLFFLPHSAVGERSFQFSKAGGRRTGTRRHGSG